MLLKNALKQVYPNPVSTTFLQNFLDSTSLTQAARVGPVLDFSRPTPAWYFGSDGYAKEAAAGEARFDHDPATGEPLGLLVEDSATYELRSSRDLSAADWDTTGATIAQDQVGLDGNANTGWSVTGDDATQSLTVTDDSATHTLVFPIRKDGDATRVFAQFSGGTTTLDYQADLDVSAGTVTAGGDAASSDLEVRDWGDFWMVAISAANNNTGNTTLTYGFRPVTLSETAKYDNGAIHLNRSVAPVSPPMPTGGSAVTRAADDVSTTDVSWLASDRGTFVVNYRLGPSVNEGNRIFALSNSDFSDRIYVFDFNIRYHPAEKLNLVPLNESPFLKSKIAIAYIESEEISTAQDGSIIETKTVSNPIENPSDLFVGQKEFNNKQLKGHIASIEYTPVRLSDDFLKSKTS